jgi:NADH-quinone oxidoreductase subunit N
MPPLSVVPTIAARDFLYVAPEILLTAWGLLVLIVDFAALRGRPEATRRRTLGLLSLAGVLVTLFLTYYDAPTLFGTGQGTGSVASVSDDADPYLFFGTLAGDAATVRLNIVVVALLALVVGLSMTWPFTEYWGEYFALLLWAAVGMMLLIAAEELLTLFLTLELMTLCLYLMTAIEKARRRSPEAGLKYFVYGSVSSALFLFGLSFLYGLTGTTRLDAIRNALTVPGALHPGLAGNVAGTASVLLILAGFGFKVAAVPFHQWAPDAYEGAPAPVTAWIASGSKLASFVAMMKVFNHALYPWAQQGDVVTTPGWIMVLMIVSALSMTFGNLAALAQRNLKRLLAYSSIAHAGYLLVGVIAVSVRPRNDAAAGAVLFYLVTYAFTTVGAFALAAWLARDHTTDDLDDLNGLGLQAPGLAVCVVILMLSLIGVPPLAGFFGKLYMFMEALNTQETGRLRLTWLVALALLNSMISAFYYVRVLKAMFLRPPGRVPARDASPGISLPIVLSTLVVLIFGLAPSLLLEPMKGAAVVMLSPGGGAPGYHRLRPAGDAATEPPPAPTTTPPVPPVIPAESVSAASRERPPAAAGPRARRP